MVKSWNALKRRDVRLSQSPAAVVSETRGKYRNSGGSARAFRTMLYGSVTQRARRLLTMSTNYESEVSRLDAGLPRVLSGVVGY